MAKLKSDIVSMVQQRFDREQVAGVIEKLARDSASYAADQDAQERKFRAGIEGSIKEIVDWYDLLIRASNVVFQIEYWSRTLVT